MNRINYNNKQQFNNKNDHDKMSKTNTNDSSIVEVHSKFQMANIPHNRLISVFSVSQRQSTILPLSITIDTFNITKFHISTKVKFHELVWTQTQKLNCQFDKSQNRINFLNRRLNYCRIFIFLIDIKKKKSILCNPNFLLSLYRIWV